MGALKNYSQVGLIAIDEAVRRSSVFSSLQEAMLALQYLLSSEEISADTDTRLQKVTGMVLGGINDLTVDTGAITGSNAGGSNVIARRIITGADGNSFTFYAKWPDSFTTVINCTDTGDATYIVTKIKDSKYHVDLDTLNPNDYYKMDSGIDLSEYGITDTTIKAATFGEMKSAIQTAIKGLYNYWLREGAKLNYDSLGLALDGQTIEINFGAGGDFDAAAAITTQLVGNSSQDETFSYNTKSAVITNYDEDDTIYFDKAVNNFSVSDTFNDFQVESSAENKLILRDVRGKTMTFSTPNGTAYAYMAADSAEVDGKNFGSGNNFEILFGANYENSILRAGNGGSYLWGGKLGNDELFGGIG